MIKICDQALIIPLKIIYKNCIAKGVFPQIWKQANVVPVHKKDSKYLKQNYRPISLLPVLGKIFAKLIYNHLYKHFCVNKVPNSSQSGFRPNDSTISQLLSIVHMVFSSFDCSPLMDVRSVYFDIAKAFDCVWHEGLIYKLRSCGVSGNLPSLLQSFLDNRKQRTVLNGKAAK